MMSRIYRGTVSHTRVTPVRHHFSYPVFFFALDIDELETLDRKVTGFGYNRFAPLSIRDADYLDGTGSLRERVSRHLPEHLSRQETGRVMLVTTPRYFNYVFNPVNFWYVFETGGKLTCVIAEVNNTFGERHLYRLEPEGGDTPRFQAQAEKVFHVSPFFDRSGTYQFTLSEPAERIRIRIQLEKNDGPRILTQLSGDSRPLTTGSLWRTVLRFPLSAVLTFPRITWQAGRLWIQRRLPVFRKPPPDHPDTIRATPIGPLQRISVSLVKKILSRLPSDSLTLKLPDGTTHRVGAGTTETGDTPAMTIREWSFFGRLVRGTDIALGDMFTDGTWTTDDLTAVLTPFARNVVTVNRTMKHHGRVSTLFNRLAHALRRNTRRGSKRNIGAHYDLSNDFFSHWLDPTMTYSCGIFASPDDTLEQAQFNKYDRIIEKADIQPDHHVLEIGSGWGGFAIRAARQTGCRVTTVTLSAQQLELARARVAEAGLSDRIAVELCDYRDITGAFDRIVSIEMLEAVGHDYFDTFFNRLDQLLKPGGRAVIQVITIPDHRYEPYRRNPDWIQKRIFPGGMLPSLEIMGRSIRKATAMRLTQIENLGHHYAETLRCWHDRFQSATNELVHLGFDQRFQRMWRYYLSYCEAGFRTSAIYLLQLTLWKPDGHDRSPSRA